MVMMMMMIVSGLDGTCLYHRLFRLKSYERLSVVLIELQGLGFIQPEIPSKSHVWIHIYTLYTCVYHFISYIHPMKIIYHKYEDKSIFIPFIHMVLIPFYILWKSRSPSPPSEGPQTRRPGRPARCPTLRSPPSTPPRAATSASACRSRGSPGGLAAQAGEKRPTVGLEHDLTMFNYEKDGGNCGWTMF